MKELYTSTISLGLIIMTISLTYMIIDSYNKHEMPHFIIYTILAVGFIIMSIYWF